MFTPPAREFSDRRLRAATGAVVIFALSIFTFCEDEFVRKACFEGSCDDGTGVLVYYHIIYKGQFKDGKMHGHGTMQWAEGKVYNGQWAAGKPAGQGTMRFKDGREYEGTWRAGQYHGQGVMKFPDGRVYRGDFKSGKMDGFGELVYPDGHKLSGRFENDLYEGPR